MILAKARSLQTCLDRLIRVQTAGAQDLSALKVFDEVPTVTSGQSSNWNEDMENGEARFCSFSAPERKIKF